MATVLLDITMSLDGFVAGPDDSPSTASGFGAASGSTTGCSPERPQPFRRDVQDVG